MFKEVKHAYLEEKDLGRLFVIGPRDARHLVYMQAGFPDTHEAFMPLAKRLASEAGCLVGVGSMPEFGSDKPVKREGYNIDEMVKCFAQSVDALRGESTNAAADLTIAIHDWASPIGFAYTNKSLMEGRPPARIVCFDVIVSPKNTHSKRSLATTLVHLNYQSFFAFCFFVSRFSPLMAKAIAMVGSLLIFKIFGRWLNPVGWRDSKRGGSITDLGQRVYATYPYYYVWAAILSGQRSVFKGIHLPPLEKVPILFLYGTDKNTMFHTDVELTALDNAEGSEQVAVRDASHWLYLHNEELCFNKMRAFICRGQNKGKQSNL